MRAAQECSGFVGTIEAAGDFRDGEIIVGVLDGARTGALIGKSDVAFCVVVEDAAATFLLRVGGRHGCVFQHGLEGGWVIDAGETLDIRVGDDDVGVAAALGAPIVVAAARNGHVAGVAIDGDEGADQITLTIWRNQRQQRSGATVGVPYGVVIVVIGL